ncbi:MAG: hypothetical protein K1X88_15040 [Nannocystaceae bacterium]|nr:hypothetical protein [Nannocystaceae bacterium]
MSRSCSPRACAGLVLSLFVAACGSPKGDRGSDMAKALDNSKNITDHATQVDRMKKLERKAEADATKAKDDALATITTVAAPLPADIEAACAQASAGLDAFKQQRLSGPELERWNATKEPDLRKLTEACKATGSIERGVCLGSALAKAPIEFFPDAAQPELEAACEKRYAVAAPPPA